MDFDPLPPKMIVYSEEQIMTIKMSTAFVLLAIIKSEYSLSHRWMGLRPSTVYRSIGHFSECQHSHVHHPDLVQIYTR